MADMPLTRKDLKYVFEFRRHRDIYKAAGIAKIPKNQAKRFHNKIEIQEEIERQDQVVDRERARVQVEAEGITKTLLDTELLQMIMLDSKTHSAAKLRGIELGYVRAGVLQVGNTRSLDLTPPVGDEDVPAATVYQALFTVGVAAQATPIVPTADAPAARVDAATIAQRVRKMTQPEAPPKPNEPPPHPSGPVKAGRLKIG